MFEHWRQAWREAVENFWTELDRDGGASRERIAAMRRDVRRVRGELDRVLADLARSREELAEERSAEQSCRRREALARDIQDEETARLAAEFAERHAERSSVLERKVQALEAEAEMRRRDLGEMESALREVEAATERLGGDRASADPLSEDDTPEAREFRRMEREAREREAERRLEELKRRMR